MSPGPYDIHPQELGKMLQEDDVSKMLQEDDVIHSHNAAMISLVRP